ncbi:MAG: DUF4136 domain-containing protein [Proteobacteria bacterium]|nr:DUF4136 domain-containing protein [Pseudomonadota bacterium]
MKNITTLLTLLLLIGCNSIQTNIEVDSVNTFNLDNYNDFYIKINESNISAEINPIELERFKDNLKSALQERGLTYSADSNLTFDINLTTKDKVQSDRMNHYYSRYYWDRYMYRDDIRTITENVLRVNLKDNASDSTLWTVVTVWRSGSSKAATSDNGSDLIVDEIMLSFL